MIKVAVSGAAGRMGGRVITAVKEDPELQLSGALERPGHPYLGMDAGLIAGCGALDVPIIDNLNELVKGCDVLIDFSAPTVSLKNLEVCGLNNKAMVIGSTGFSPEERALAVELARTVPVMLAPNMSVGVNVMFKILKDVAKTLGDDFDVEIVELHQKEGSPSGRCLHGEVVGKPSTGLRAKWRISTVKVLRRADQARNRHARIRGGDIVMSILAYFICGGGSRSHRPTPICFTGGTV
jgi:4-hydroxy-tetrahydrodipicolinate reductase